MGIDELSVSPSMVLGVRSRICENGVISDENIQSKRLC